jgi:hypothetical protein
MREPRRREPREAQPLLESCAEPKQWRCSLLAPTLYPLTSDWRLAWWRTLDSNQRPPPCTGRVSPDAVERRSVPSSSASFGCKRVASGYPKALWDRREIHKTPASTPEDDGSAYRIRTGVTAVRGQWCRCQTVLPSVMECHLTRGEKGATATECRREPWSVAMCGCRRVARRGRRPSLRFHGCDAGRGAIGVSATRLLFIGSRDWGWLGS